MKKLFFFSLILFIVSCKKETQKSDLFLEFKHDTIFSKGNQIVFFKPSEKFYQKELKSFEGMEEVDSDFNYYANKVYDDIRNKLKLPLTALLTESRFLGIINFKNDTIFIDRYKDSLHYGALLNFENKNYEINQGVFTDNDFFENFSTISDFKQVKDNVTDIPNQIKIKSFDDKPPKEVVLDIESITEYLDFAFVYNEIDKQIDGNKITFSNSRIKIYIEKKKFLDTSSYIKDSFEGVNYDFPIEIISSINGFFDNLEIEESKINFSGLAEPNFSLSKAYQIDDNNIVIEMHNSDGAGAYGVYFFINKYGKSKRYILYP